jgi:hypothetical protein
MDDETHNKLLNADRSENHSEERIYGGEDMDYDDSVRRGELVLRDLESTFGRSMYFANDQQDAYYWGEICEPNYERNPGVPCVDIRFSCCRNLAASCTINGHPELSEEKKRKISEILAKHGFTWVDGDLLKNSPYDGVYEYFKKDAYNSPATWWDRFFEYE